MKRLILIVAFVLAACLFSACSAVQVTPSPTVSNTAAASTPTLVPTPSPDVTPEQAGDGEETVGYDDIEKIHADLKEYYGWAIESADKCRVKVGGTEYYLDTSKIMEMDVLPEYPLYRIKDNGYPEYLGTTGFAFQVFGDYIYVQSDPRWEDWPDGTLTRIINLKDLSVTQAGRDIYIYTPKEGDKVYYTAFGEPAIYIADASLEHVKRLPVLIPDKKTVDEKVGKLIGYDVSELVEDVSIVKAENGWIYFSYDMYEYEGSDFYYGHYRIKTDGSKTEKTDEGQFGDDIDYGE